MFTVALRVTVAPELKTEVAKGVIVTERGSTVSVMEAFELVTETDVAVRVTVRLLPESVAGAT